jgi:hydrogenase maturation protease
MITPGDSERPRILVAGIGNIFMGDDAFGVEVVQRLARRILPPDVRVADFGIRGLDLAYALMDDYDMVILVDATQRGGTPGTLYVIEPSVEDEDNSDAIPDAHSMDPVKVLRMAAYMGAKLKRLLLIGCEPGACGIEGRMGLSKPVESSLDEAIRLIERLIREYDFERPESGMQQEKT